MKKEKFFNDVFNDISIELEEKYDLYLPKKFLPNGLRNKIYSRDFQDNNFAFVIIFENDIEDDERIPKENWDNYNDYFRIQVFVFNNGNEFENNFISLEYKEIQEIAMKFYNLIKNADSIESVENELYKIGANT